MTSIFNCRTTSFPASLISSPSEASEEGGGSGGGEGVRWETPETRLIVALCAPLLQTVSAPACVLSIQASPMKTYEEACRRARCCMSSYSIGWPLLTELHLLLQCWESGLLSFRLFVCSSGQKKKETEDDGTFISLTPAQNICDCHEMFLSHQTIQTIKYKSAKIKELIREYEEYYEAWLQRVRSVEHEGNGVTPQMV